MNYEKCIERYKNDAEFHFLVDLFYKLKFEHKLTNGEIKDALLFAFIKFEQEQEPLKTIISEREEANMI